MSVGDAGRTKLLVSTVLLSLLWAAGFKSTKQPEVCFRALLTDGAHEEVRFERVAVGST